AENRSPDRARGKADEIGAEGQQRCGGRIVVREIKLAEHQSGSGAIEEEIVPFDRGADCGGDHCLAHLAAMVGRGKRAVSGYRTHKRPPDLDPTRVLRARYRRPRIIYAHAEASVFATTATNHALCKPNRPQPQACHVRSGLQADITDGLCWNSWRRKHQCRSGFHPIVCNAAPKNGRRVLSLRPRTGSHSCMVSARGFSTTSR